jgi:hypothetical protein
MSSKVKLYTALKSSYGDQSANQRLEKKGYRKDSELSNDNQQVWYRPNDKRLLVNVAGTHNLKDWGTDLYLGLGKLKDTNRYKEADNILKKSKEKYGVSSATVTGHSLGHSIASNIAKPEDKMYGLDGGFTFGQKARDYDNNHFHFRTKGDLVSVLGSNEKNMRTLGNNNVFKDPLSSHNVDNIKNEKIFV